MEKYQCGYFHKVYAKNSYLGGVHNGVNEGKGLEGVCVYMDCIPGCSVQGSSLPLVRDEKGNYRCSICRVIRIESHPEENAQNSRLSGIPDW